MPDAHPFAPEELFEHAEFLKQLARRLLRDEHLAEDVAQETLIAALEHPPHERGALRAWLARTARNLALNRKIATARRRWHEHSAARSEHEDAQLEALERLELQRTVFEQVLALDEAKRTVLFLRYHEGLQPAAIAARLALPVKTVKSRLVRGLAELRERLERRYGCDAGGDRRALGLALASLARGPTPAAATGAGLALKLALGAAAVLGSFLAWQAARPATRSPALARIDNDAPLVPSDGPTATSLASVASVPRQPFANEGEFATLELRLVWEEDGTPAAGIGVAALSSNDPAPRPRRTRAWSDPSGVARFEGLVPGTIELTLDRGRKSLVELAAGERRALELALPAGVDVVGRVVSDSGVALAGATIWVVGGSAWPEPWDVATSAADGSFRLRDLASFLQLGARAPSHLASASHAVYDLAATPLAEASIELVLPAGGELARGRVRAARGEPIAGAEVWIGLPYRMARASPSAVRASTGGPCVVRTDTRGEFTSANRLEAGVHDLVVLAPGHACFRGTLEVGESAPGWVEIWLEEPVTLTGRVLSATGEPVSDARVEAEPAFAARRGVANGIPVLVVFSVEDTRQEFTHDPPSAPLTPAELVRATSTTASTPSPVQPLDGRNVAQRIEAYPPPALRATTDADGRFTLGWSSAGSMDLSASVPGRPELGRARVRLAAGAERACEVRLDPGLSLTGRVIDAAGRGLAGVRVHALPETPWPDEPPSTHTDSEGTFALFNLLPGSHRLQARAPGQSGWVPSEGLVVTSGASPVELVIETPVLPRTHVSGVLIGADGRVPAARLLLSTPAERTVAQVQRDERTGAFRFAGVEPGRYRVQALLGSTRIVAASETFELREGMSFDLGELRVEAPGALELTLVGGPEANAPELARDGFGSASLVQSDVQNGYHASLQDLAPGTWWLRARTPGLFVADQPVEITSGATLRLALELEPGFVTAAAFEFPPDASPESLLQVEVRDARGALLLREPPRPLASPWARGVILSLPPGPAVLAAWTETGAHAEVAFEVRAGDNEVLTLALR